jgi:hypothetical protein
VATVVVDGQVDLESCLVECGIAPKSLRMALADHIMHVQ